MTRKMKATIRRAEPTETESLSSIALAAKRHWGYPEEWMNLWKDEFIISPKYVSQEHVYCADSGSGILGFYSVESRPEFWEFENFWVLPSAMGKGIGRMLFNHVTNLIRSYNGKRLRIVSDLHAEGFYVKMGAHNIGSIPSKIKGRNLPLLELQIT